MVLSAFLIIAAVLIALGSLRLISPNKRPTTFSVQGLSVKRSRLEIIKLPSLGTNLKRMTLL